MCSRLCETSRNEIAWRSNTYCLPWFFPILWGNEHQVVGTFDNSRFEPIEILWLFIPLLVLNIQKHVG